jgi:hypothetical protein
MYMSIKRYISPQLLIFIKVISMVFKVANWVPHGAGTAYPSGALEFTTGFKWGFVLFDL